MNDYITKANLIDLGVELDDESLQKLVDELNAKVDELVGNEIIASLTSEDVDKLADMQDTASEDEIAEWVIDHVPDYEEIMEDNKDIVLGDYVENSDLLKND